VTTLRDIAWFARTSWAYLGCNGGSARWSARRRYLAGFILAARRFAAARRSGRKVADQ
jgi:hypothetical protein